MQNIDKDAFLLDPCVATTGFEFLCKAFAKLDIEALAKDLKKRKIFIEKNNSPFFVVIKTKLGEVSIFSNIKLIVRVSTKEEAYEVLETLLPSINKCLQG